MLRFCVRHWRDLTAAVVARNLSTFTARHPFDPNAPPSILELAGAPLEDQTGDPLTDQDGLAIAAGDASVYGVMRGGWEPSVERDADLPPETAAEFDPVRHCGAEVMAGAREVPVPEMTPGGGDRCPLCGVADFVGEGDDAIAQLWVQAAADDALTLAQIKGFA